MTVAAPHEEELDEGAAPTEGEVDVEGFVRVTRRFKRLFADARAPLTWRPIWESLRLRLFHGGWRRVQPSEIAEECGLCIRTVKRVFRAFEILRMLNIRHTSGGSYKKCNWLQLLELPKQLQIPDSLRRFGERRRRAEAAAAKPETSTVIQAATEAFLGEIAAAPDAGAAPGSGGTATEVWTRILAGFGEGARAEVARHAHPRTITRGVLVVEAAAEHVEYVEANFVAGLRYQARGVVDDVVVVRQGEAWPATPAATVGERRPESLADEALRMVREFHQAVHGVSDEIAAQLRLGAGVVRPELELATGLLETHHVAAWGFVGRAVARLARQSYRGETFLYLIPHLAREGARWPGQDATAPPGMRRQRT